MSDNTLVSDYGMCEEEQVARIARFYYHDGLTQSEISERLGLTRLKVSSAGERASVRYYSRTNQLPLRRVS